MVAVVGVVVGVWLWWLRLACVELWYVVVYGCVTIDIKMSEDEKYAVE